MISASLNVPPPSNEPVYGYAPGCPEREKLKATAKQMMAEQVEIPLVIGGERVKTGDMGTCVCPHDHQHTLASYHKATTDQVNAAIAAAGKAHPAWSRMSTRSRLSIFIKAADLLATKYRATLNAATMLNQSKTAHQAEIDSACELIDFLRFNTFFAQRLEQEQPVSSPTMWNYVDHRPLEGFVFAVTPFNFTAIAGNLPTSPAMMGNTVVWKPASTAVFSGHLFMKILEEAGLPPGVINFVPGSGGQVGDPALKHPDLAGVHFTGSTPVFQRMWKTIGDNIANYKTYPRIVGETGGKDFIVAHPSSDVDGLVTAIVRGAYEYQGQKCSAASRLYLPKSLHATVRDQVIERIRGLKIGSPLDFRNFLAAVIDKVAYGDITEYIDYAKSSSDAEVLIGEYDDSEGYFIKPTLIEAKTPDFKLLREEIFGPVMTYYVYDDDKFEETLDLCDRTSPYALTGAVFAQDRNAVNRAMDKLRYAAGNFYVNDKPTGAVVGQQPFGGGRASGTNDKAGSILNLQRWISPRTVKETFLPAADHKYPFMDAE